MPFSKYFTHVLPAGPTRGDTARRDHRQHRRGRLRRDRHARRRDRQDPVARRRVGRVRHVPAVRARLGVARPRRSAASSCSRSTSCRTSPVSSARPQASCDWVTGSGGEFVNRAANAIMKAIADHADRADARELSHRSCIATRHRIGSTRTTCGLVVHDWGGDGPPVLLAHPTGFHGVVWAPVAERLVAAGRRVWSFDFRGHGDSDAPALDDGRTRGTASPTTCSRSRRHLGLDRRPALVACGHSKGGAALLLGEAKQPGTYSADLGLRADHVPGGTAARRDDFRSRASARKRRNELASERRGVRRRTRRSRRSTP